MTLRLLFSTLLGLAVLVHTAEAQEVGGLKQRLTAIEDAAKARAEEWLGARNAEGIRCTKCGGKPKKCSCVSGIKRKSEKTFRAFLSAGARKGYRLTSAKRRTKFFQDLIAGRALGDGQRRSFSLASGKVTGVRILERSVVVTSTVRGDLDEADAVEISSWVRVKGTWYLKTPHDKAVDVLMTADEVELLTERRRADQLKPAIKDALDWLVRHQTRGGSWSTTGWHGNCPCPNDRAGDHRYDVGVTGLAVLALCQGGRAATSPAVRGVVWLGSQQKADGSIGFKVGETIYNHAIAAQALCAVASKTGDVGLRTRAQKAVEFCVTAQNPGLGWKYGVKTGRNDTSVTCWMLAALVAGRDVGLEIPPGAFKGALRWFDRVTDNNNATSYETMGGGSSFLPQTDGKYDRMPTMTAAALAGRVTCGKTARSGSVKDARAILLRSLPRWTARSTRRVSYYYWFWGSRGLGAIEWKGAAAWRDAAQRALIDNQSSNGCAKGSWSRAGEWAIAGGTVYSTAVNAMTLEQLLN